VSAFLVVTPLGMPKALALLALLRERDITVVERLPLRRWSVASSRLYMRSWTAPAIARAGRFQQRWRQLFPTDSAECWRLRTREDHARLVLAKAELRLQFRSAPLGPAQPGEPTFQLHAFHVPDVDAITAEAARLLEFLPRHRAHAPAG
jgi:hypothetical protein